MIVEKAFSLSKLQVLNNLDVCFNRKNEALLFRYYVGVSKGVEVIERATYSLRSEN